MAPAIKPLRVFRDIDEFARRHKLGTEAEFEADQQRIDQLNKEEHKFQAWYVQNRAVHCPFGSPTVEKVHD